MTHRQSVDASPLHLASPTDNTRGLHHSKSDSLNALRALFRSLAPLARPLDKHESQGGGNEPSKRRASNWAIGHR